MQLNIEEGQVPLVDDGYDTTCVNADLQPSRLSHVKMLAGRVTPTTIVAWKSVVWRAEVCRGDSDRRPPLAPSRVGIIVTLDQVTLSASSSIVKQCSAQCSSISPIAS